MSEFTGDQLEQIFHTALQTGDTHGVEAALTVMATVDPHRAVRLYEDTKTALAICKMLGLHGGETP